MKVQFSRDAAHAINGVINNAIDQIRSTPAQDRSFAQMRELELLLDVPFSGSLIAGCEVSPRLLYLVGETLLDYRNTVACRKPTNHLVHETLATGLAEVVAYLNEIEGAAAEIAGKHAAAEIAGKHAAAKRDAKTCSIAFVDTIDAARGTLAKAQAAAEAMAPGAIKDATIASFDAAFRSCEEAAHYVAAAANRLA